MVDVGVENAHGVRAAAHTRDDGIGLLAVQTCLRQQRWHLLKAFVANDTLEIANHHGVGVRTGHRANDVEGVVDIGHPVAHGFIQSIFERTAARGHGHHGGAQKFHAVHIGALTLHIFSAHVDHAFEAVACANGGRGHAVLACACFGNDARLAHALGQHGLTNGVVDFVRARVVQVFALQINLSAAHFTAHARCVINGGGAANKVRQFVLKLGQKLGVVLVLGVGFAQFENGMCQGFADKAAAINTEVAGGVGLLVIGHGVTQWHRLLSRQPQILGFFGHL